MAQKRGGAQAAANIRRHPAKPAGQRHHFLYQGRQPVVLQARGYHQITGSKHYKQLSR